ncbi:MAG: SAM-dependent chlorinase/fluorinase [Bacteroides sp.]|nr:SAM-dependent chlorinase/fluorinase [Ruminococcus flavefaciens]MCM1553920.1 SAM-dependent chlorinase/fluorinase [Bacteroides sp.]
MRTITLLSDWGTSDHYAAVVRARLYALLPEVRVVDISHQVPRDDIYAAALMAFDSYSYFPEGTIHIIGVDDIASSENMHLVVKFDGHFFIGADNGFFRILQSISGKEADAVYEIMEVYQDTSIFTFSTRDLFVKVAARLVLGVPLDQIGHETKFKSKLLDGSRLFVQRVPQRDREGHLIGWDLTGSVLRIDGFGNVITNIPKSQYAACLVNFPFSALLFNSWNEIKGGRFVDSYKDVLPGEAAFIFLANGFLEISVNRGEASALFGISDGSKVVMRFGLPKR